MSYYYAEKLDMFADLATYSYQDDEHFYLDASEPDNIQSARQFLDNELGFLSSSDKRSLEEAWQAAIRDCRDTKVFLSAIKVLKDKYDQPIRPHTKISF